MKKIVIAPDKFKETMTNFEVANIIERTLKEKYPNIETIILPLSDGGEGSVETVCLTTKDNMQTITVSSANFELTPVKYGCLPNRHYLIDVASCLGFKHKKATSTPANTSSYGVGELILEILKLKPKKIFVCLGGTITTDGGVGMAAALGAKFYNSKNESFIPVGDTLTEINKIDLSEMNQTLKGVKIWGLNDVNNPLYGPNGASYVFAKQKGANDEMIAKLDLGLRHLAKITFRDLNVHFDDEPGSGAAGGIGFAILSFFQGILLPGIDTIMTMIDYKRFSYDADLIITGEGRLDKQTLNGKVIDGVLRFSREKAIKTIAIVGSLEGHKEEYIKWGLDDIYITNEENLPFSEVKKYCQQQLRETVKKINL